MDTTPLSVKRIAGRRKDSGREDREPVGFLLEKGAIPDVHPAVLAGSSLSDGWDGDDGGRTH